PDMAVARDDLVVVAQIFVDGFRLCGRLYDDDFHVSVLLRRPTTRNDLGGRVINDANINVRIPSCRDDVRLYQRVPAREGEWQPWRLTSGIGAPIRQPQPASVPIVPGSAQSPHPLRARSPAPASSSARSGPRPLEPRAAVVHARSAAQAAPAHLRRPRSA